MWSMNNIIISSYTYMTNPTTSEGLGYCEHIYLVVTSPTYVLTVIQKHLMK